MDLGAEDRRIVSGWMWSPLKPARLSTVGYPIAAATLARDSQQTLSASQCRESSLVLAPAGREILHNCVHVMMWGIRASCHHTSRILQHPLILRHLVNSRVYMLQWQMSLFSSRAHLERSPDVASKDLSTLQEPYLPSSAEMHMQSEYLQSTSHLLHCHCRDQTRLHPLNTLLGNMSLFGHC